MMASYSTEEDRKSIRCDAINMSANIIIDSGEDNDKDLYIEDLV